MMRFFILQDFCRKAKKALVTTADLCAAIRRAEDGSIDAYLGSGLIKQRISRVGAGRSGGFRSIIYYRRGDMAVFLHMFAKNAQDALSITETKTYRKFAKILSELTDEDIRKLVKTGHWQELLCEDLSQ